LIDCILYASHRAVKEQYSTLHFSYGTVRYSA